MRAYATTAALLLLASAASGRSYVQPTDYVLSRRDVLFLPYVSEEPTGQLVRRQAQAGGGGGLSGTIQQLPPEQADNSTSYDQDTNAACIDALKVLPRSSNPSGNCLCYNLPMLDTNRGVFMADLRVFRVSEPREAFVGVAPNDIDVGVQYNGASVTLASDEQIKAVEGGRQLMVTRRDETTISRRDEETIPQLLHTYMFVGQIDKDRMSDNLSMATLESLITPTFTLTAKNTAGGAVSTNVSLNEAAFLNGIFSKQVVMSDFASAGAAVDAKLAALNNGTVAFVLPGVQILIFPVGLIITGAWVLIGATVYGIGTYERAVYARTWRKRQAAAAAASGRPI